MSESHLANITDNPTVATTGAKGPDIGVATSKAALMDSKFLVLTVNMSNHDHGKKRS
jgi:hypothetical protein